MAAGQGAIKVKQVLELVFNDIDDPENEENSSDESQSSGKEAVKQRIVCFLESLEGEPAFNQSFFRDSVLEMLTSLLHVPWKQLQETADVEAFRFLSSLFNYLPVMRRECVHWLNAIYQRLSRRNPICNPYYQKI